MKHKHQWQTNIGSRHGSIPERCFICGAEKPNPLPQLPRPLQYDWDEDGGGMLEQIVNNQNKIISYLKAREEEGMSKRGSKK